MYLYYAVFSFDDDGISVVFPDLDGAFTSGSDMHEALFMSKDLLAGWLINAEDDKEDFPLASDIDDIVLEQGDLLVPVEVNLALEREKFDNQLVKKTLTIPRYINTLGVETGINFSQLLSESIKEKLNVN